MKILTISSGGMPQRTLSMAGRGNALGMVFFLGVCAIVSPLLAVFLSLLVFTGPYKEDGGCLRPWGWVFRCACRPWYRLQPPCRYDPMDG